VHIYFSLCWKKKKKPTLASWWPTHVEISCFAKEVVDGQLLICLVPSRVSWSFCFLSHKTREVHISCPGKNQTNKIHRFNDTWHTYSDIDRALNITRTYVCPGLFSLLNLFSCNSCTSFRFPGNMGFSQNLFLIITASVILVDVATACSNGQCKVLCLLFYLHVIKNHFKLWLFFFFC